MDLGFTAKTVDDLPGLNILHDWEKFYSQVEQVHYSVRDISEQREIKPHRDMSTQIEEKIGKLEKTQK